MVNPDQRLFTTEAQRTQRTHREDESIYDWRSNLSPTTLRVIGFLFLVAAAVVAVLNLKRVANLGMMWLSPPLMIVGLAFVAFARKK